MIAKVEPLTTARALSGPFDYRLGERHAGVREGSLLLVPFGRRRALGVVVGLTERSDMPPDRLVEPIAALDGDVPSRLVSLGLWVAREYCSTPARGLALVLPPGTGAGSTRRISTRRTLVAQLAEGGDVDGERVGPRQRAVLAALAEGPRPAAELGHATLRRLEQRGLVRLSPEAGSRRPAVPPIGARGRVDGLTKSQREALAAVEDAIATAPERFLLHGVTGSGKTEVYLRAVEAALARGRSAIVLVPEIALAPQTMHRFAERFGDGVAVLHSRLSARERYDEWARLRSGDARVCVGPRSAVFAPLDEVGLIVVDEEHAASYKQEGDPRYDARVVAERRAAEEDAVLLAGSATPRPESFHRYRRLLLPKRVDGRRLPPVEVVRSLESRGPLHQATLDALDDVRRRREKAIVLLNRRGWSNFLSCRSCGRVWSCPNCDVTLVLHRAVAELACHHCGWRKPVPGACPDCGSASLARHGAGAEQLENELRRAVAPLAVFRLDSDSADGAGGIAEILRGFERSPAGVLVGTQMVAKGHDFPEVTLGVVVDADATLRFPDFRAEERTFALVAQLAGRSGRGERGGRVIVQALDADARALRHAAAHDSEGFLRGELARREALAYPPFGHLIRAVCSAIEPGPEAAAAEALRERIATAGIPVLGPAPLFRRQGRHRAQLVVKSREREPAITVVRAAVQAAAAGGRNRGVSFSVDVDPQ